jgi:hypothetical protein
LRESHGVSHHSTVVEVIIATEAQAEIDNLLTEKHETEIVVAGIVQERDQARAEIDRLRAALKVTRQWVIYGDNFASWSSCALFIDEALKEPT